jgi:hypothetical protein
LRRSDARRFSLSRATWQAASDRASEIAVDSAKGEAARANKAFDDGDAALAWMVAQSKITKRAGLDKDFSSCRAETYIEGWLAVGFGGIAGLVAFALAYVLGGSFWRPPKSI